MGIDFHALKLLQYVASTAPLGDVATLGRQAIITNEKELRETLRLPRDKHYGPFCEDLLIEQFKASSVVSFDASDYEQATILHDMNEPLEHAHQYDTVIDIGTIEHIFNLPVAFKNIANICKPSGRIVHALPANNYNGHGFWQFSPELFFSLYSTSNGFSETEIYIADLDDEQNWWKPNVPANGVRVEYTSASRSYILVITRKRVAGTTQNVQQSDYVSIWEDGDILPAVEPKGRRAVIKSAVERIPRIGPRLVPIIGSLSRVVFPSRNSHADARLHRLSASNRHYRKIPIVSLIG